jgi:hypothetical protein
MVYIQPGSLHISPIAPDTGTAITFAFTAVEDEIDLLTSAFGLSTTFYVLTKPTSVQKWTQRGSWDCVSCFDIAHNFARNTRLDFQISIDALTSDTWDFMVIDKGDFLTKVPPYDSSRTASLTGVRISTAPVDPNGKPSVVVGSNAPDAQITISGSSSGTVEGWSTATYIGQFGESVTITIMATGYMPYTHTLNLQSGTTPFTALLSPCSASTPGCAGYVAPPCTSDASCGSGQTCTGGKCVGATGLCTGSDTITNLLCQYKDYIPYILVGAVLLFAMMPSQPKQQQPIIIASK